MNIIKIAREKIKKFKEKRRIEDEKIKSDIIYQLTTPWTEEQTKFFNLTVIMNSAGWLGGNYTEKEAKRIILGENAKYFTDEELNKLEFKIENPDIKVKKLHM